jgi:hypothetical protein
MKKVIITVLLAIAVSTFANYSSKQTPESLNASTQGTPLSGIPAHNSRQ